jgi:hypothetical protein
VLVRLSAEGSTGTLTVQGAEDVLAVRFRGGEIVGADALRESFEQGLGRLLVEADLLTPAQVSEVAAADLSGTVVDHLVSSEMVPAEDLSACLRDHGYRLLLSLLRWPSGEFQFYEGEVSWNRAVQPLSVEELLVRSSEEQPKVVGGTIPPLGRETLRPALQGRNFKVISWDEGEEVAGEAWVTPLEEALLKSLDGLTPTAEFHDLLGVDDYRLRFALHRLVGFGLVEEVRGPESAPAPAIEDAPAKDWAAPPVEEVVPARPATPPPSALREAAGKAARREDLGGLLADLSRGFSYVLATGLAGLLIALVLWGGSKPHLHHPFPWQEAQRAERESLRVEAAFQRLAGRLSTHHVLFGDFPQDLDSSSEILLPEGLEIELRESATGFVLELQSADGADRQQLRFESTGNFLLDPGFTRASTSDVVDPVVLVD